MMTIETDCDNPRVNSLRKTLTHAFNMGWAGATTSANKTNSLCFSANGKLTLSNWRD
jgi:hypothetical protein